MTRQHKSMRGTNQMYLLGRTLPWIQMTGTRWGLMLPLVHHQCSTQSNVRTSGFYSTQKTALKKRPPRSCHSYRKKQRQQWQWLVSVCAGGRERTRFVVIVTPMPSYFPHSLIFMSLRVPERPRKDRTYRKFSKEHAKSLTNAVNVLYDWLKKVPCFM